MSVVRGWLKPCRPLGLLIGTRLSSLCLPECMGMKLFSIWRYSFHHQRLKFKIKSKLKQIAKLWLEELESL